MNSVLTSVCTDNQMSCNSLPIFEGIISYKVYGSIRQNTVALLVLHVWIHSVVFLRRSRRHLQSQSSLIVLLSIILYIKKSSQQSLQTNHL